MNLIARPFVWDGSRLLSMNGALVVLTVICLYAAHVSLDGYPTFWKEIRPCDAAAPLHEHLGPPDAFDEKWGTSIWRSYHFLGWFELHKERGGVFIYSYFGLGDLSKEKLLFYNVCSYCVEESSQEE